MIVPVIVRMPVIMVMMPVIVRMIVTVIVMVMVMPVIVRMIVVMMSVIMRVIVIVVVMSVAGLCRLSQPAIDRLPRIVQHIELQGVDGAPHNRSRLVAQSIGKPGQAGKSISHDLQGNSGMQQRGHGHVAAHPGETIEIGNLHG